MLTKEMLSAKVALEVFAYRVAKYVGSYVAAMNGVDVIAFTAGIGENRQVQLETLFCNILDTLELQ